VSGEYRVGTAENVSVRFVDSDDGALSVLEIENPRDHTVFSEVRSTLHAAGIDVVSFEVRVEQDALRGRLKLTNSSGGPLDPESHLDIQARVLQVVLAQPRSTRPPPIEAAG